MMCELFQVSSPVVKFSLGSSPGRVPLLRTFQLRPGLVTVSSRLDRSSRACRSVHQQAHGIYMLTNGMVRVAPGAQGLGGTATRRAARAYGPALAGTGSTSLQAAMYTLRASLGITGRPWTLLLRNARETAEVFLGNGVISRPLFFLQTDVDVNGCKKSVVQILSFDVITSRVTT
jgi:hypothetical protein